MTTKLPLALAEPNPEVFLRPVTLRDADILMRRCWPHNARSSLYRLITRALRLVEQHYGIGVVACDGEGAFAYGQLTAWPRCGEISDLIVGEPYRRRGTGTAIIQHLARTARDMHVTCLEIGVAVDNPGAAALYRRLGFQDSYTVRLSLERGDIDVVYMRLDLPAEPTPETGQGIAEML